MIENLSNHLRNSSGNFDPKIKQANNNINML